MKENINFICDDEENMDSIDVKNKKTTNIINITEFIYKI